MSNDLTTRSFTVQPSTADDTTRSVEAVLATADPVEVSDWAGNFVETLRMDGARILSYTPLCDSHNRASIHDVLGDVRNIRVDGDRLVGRIYFSADEDGRKTYEKYRDGHARDVSVGYRVLDKKDVGAGETAQVNGRSYTAPQDKPLRVTTKWELRELSCTAIGADPNAKTRGAHAAEGKKVMPELETKTEETPTLDPKVELAIRRVLDEYPCSPELTARALSGEMDEAQVRKAIMEEFKTKNFPQGPAGIEITRGEVDQTDALAWRFRTLAGDSPHTEQERMAFERSKQFGGCTLVELADECLRANRMPTTGSPAMRLERAFSTRGGSFTNFEIGEAYGAAINGTLQQAYLDADDSTMWVAEHFVPDFTEYSVFKFEYTGGEVIASGGKAKHGQGKVSQEKGSVVMIGGVTDIPYQAMVNDSLAVLMRVPREMARRMAQLKKDLLYSILNANPTMSSDSTALFHDDHGNLSEGSTSALDAEQLQAEFAAFLAKTDSYGNPIGVRPKYVIVNPSDYFAAKIICASSDRYADASQGSLNPLQSENLQVITDARLAAAGAKNPITQVTQIGSGTAWYLAADPAMAPHLAFLYLEGQRTPQIRTGQLDHGSWGIWFDVQQSFGVVIEDYNGIRKMTGTT